MASEWCRPQSLKRFRRVPGPFQFGFQLHRGRLSGNQYPVGSECWASPASVQLAPAVLCVEVAPLESARWRATERMKRRASLLRWLAREGITLSFVNPLAQTLLEISRSGVD